tara:strand:- start:1393 stop:2388 length:996 start_codon:yes stop_codon:yes gene_type:complete
MKVNDAVVISSHRFYISKEDKRKVWDYAQSAYDEFKSEITGMMVVLQDDEGDYIIQDPVILKQEVSGASCEIDEDEMAMYTCKMMSKYSGEKVRFLWWHSHHNLGVFWSGTDDKNILVNKTEDFNLSLVVGLDGDYLLRLQFFEPVETYVNTEMHVLGEESGVPDEITKEVKELCNHRTYSVKLPIHRPVYTNQASLPLTAGNTNGYGYQYDSYDDVYATSYGTSYGKSKHYNNEYKEYVDIEKVPEAVMERAMKVLNSLLDDCYDLASENDLNTSALKLWKDKIPEVEKLTNPHGLGIRKYDTSKSLSHALYTLWPDDFFYETNKETCLV